MLCPIWLVMGRNTRKSEEEECACTRAAYAASYEAMEMRGAATKKAPLEETNIFFAPPKGGFSRVEPDVFTLSFSLYLRSSDKGGGRGYSEANSVKIFGYQSNDFFEICVSVFCGIWLVGVLCIQGVIRYIQLYVLTLPVLITRTFVNAKTNLWFKFEIRNFANLYFCQR